MPRLRRLACLICGLPARALAAHEAGSRPVAIPVGELPRGVAIR